ncbi:RNA ligase [Citrobacter phage CkP1]|nr:RNA ligase [Citrobacter phage CkP1]
MKKLFKNLMALCDEADESKFFYRDDISPSGLKYRIFSYNYASYSDWIRPDALECRGIMFEMIDDKPVRIASRPMEKFFNLNETPFTMNLDLSKAKYMLDKADGSLVSTFLDGNILKFKSKSSIKSEQSYFSTAMLTESRHEALLARLLDLASDGFTANFEYVSPDNRIVLPYQEKQLILLNIRDNDTGEYVDYEDIFKDGVLRQYLVQRHEITDSNFVEDIRKLTDIEGFVFVMEDGLRFKLKTDWYCALHHTKDSITNNERLFESIVNNASDDLKAMFAGDEFAVNKINKFEENYLKYLGESLHLINTTYHELRGRDRKDYAIESQNRANKSGLGFLFSIIMKMYNGGMDHDTRVKNLSELFMKNYKQFVPKEFI